MGACYLVKVSLIIIQQGVGPQPRGIGERTWQSIDIGSDVSKMDNQKLEESHQGYLWEY